MSAVRASGEARSAVFLAAVIFVFFAPIFLTGRTLFWGDLTYLHHAWRASPAQLIQSGRPPLWEPSLYLGMPMAASMQGALFYPATIFFYLFGFATATALFEVLHLFFIGWFTALWFRSLRLSWGASVATGTCLALSGLLISRLPFLNHLAVLSYIPVLALFFSTSGALSLSLGLMFVAGYPTFMPGAVVMSWMIALALRSRQAASASMWLRNWSAAGAAALVLCAVQFIPAAELVALSRRSSGVIRTEALQWGFQWDNLRQWVSPLLVPWSSFKPAVEWWMCVYLGFVAAGFCVWGLWRMPRPRAALLALALLATALLTLGDTTSVSRWLWMNWYPLKFVRYPGNLAYLAILPLSVAIAAGCSSSRHAPVLALAAVIELIGYGWLSTPKTSRTLFTEAGPLVRDLQERQGQARYLISPRALEASNGANIVDWKTRLYGLTNAPFRLRAVANFGEPLVPQRNYEFMDRLLSARGADEAAAWMPWAGASRLLTPTIVSTPLLRSESRQLWEIARLSVPAAMAYFFTTKAGDVLPPTLPDVPPALGHPLSVERDREDRFSISGKGSGWIFVAEPRYPGWRAVLETPEGTRDLATLPALGAFQKASVPAGPWRVRFYYDPASWRWGIVTSLFGLLAFAAYWYHRTSRLLHVAK